MTTRGCRVCGSGHLMCWVRIGDIDGKERVGGGGGDGMVAGDGSGLGAKCGELAGESIDLELSCQYVYILHAYCRLNIPQLLAPSRTPSTTRRR